MLFKHILRRFSCLVTISIAAFSIRTEIIAQGIPAERHIQLEALNKYAPVEITAVVDHSVKYPNPLGVHQAITLTDKDDSWLANISLAILNQSIKHISAIEIQFDVPAWQSSPLEPKKIIFVCIGKLPSNAPRYSLEGQPESESQAPLDIKPGGEFMLPLASVFPLLRDYHLRTTPIGSVDNIWVRIRRVFFDDETMWVTNSYLKPDKSHPGVYARITREEFESKQ